MEDKRVGYFLGGQTCRRRAQPGPAAPRRAPPRLDPLVVCLGFGFGRAQNTMGQPLPAWYIQTASRTPAIAQICGLQTY